MLSAAETPPKQGACSQLDCVVPGHLVHDPLQDTVWHSPLEDNDGKQLINADNICKFFAIRGVFEPSGSDIELITRGRREAEVHNYVTRVTQCAGPGFAFDHARLA